jgi:short-subunit dehydrogenase
MKLTQAFLPGFINRRSGHILSIASSAGLSGTAHSVAYSASKFAVNGFSESLRQELSK